VAAAEDDADGDDEREDAGSSRQPAPSSEDAAADPISGNGDAGSADFVSDAGVPAKSDAGLSTDGASSSTDASTGDSGAFGDAEEPVDQTDAAPSDPTHPAHADGGVALDECASLGPTWTGALQDGLDVYDHAHSIAAGNCGQVVFGGSSSPTDGQIASVSLLDANGELLWRQFPSNGDTTSFRLSSVLSDGQSGALYAGTLSMTSDNTVAIVGRFDEHGGWGWGATLGTDGTTTGRDLSMDAAGKVFVWGTSDEALPNEIGGDGSAYVAKFASDGTHEWTVRYDGAGAIADGDGNTYLLTWAPGETLFTEVVLVKLDPSGQELWRASLAAPAVDPAAGFDTMMPSDLALSGDGTSVFAAGNFSQAECVDPCPYLAVLGKFDSQGTPEWTAQPTAGAVLGTSVRELAVNHDGSNAFYITDATSVACVDGSGSVAWEFLPAEGFFPDALTTDANGDVIVAGGGNAASPSAENQTDWTLVRLDATDGSAL
jgi:hypothetical protein